MFDRRIFSLDNMANELQKLTDLHRDILMLHFMGKKHVDIAEALCISPGTVSAIVNSPLGESLLDRMRKTQLSKLNVIAEELHLIVGENTAMVSEALHDGRIPRVKDAADGNDLPLFDEEGNKKTVTIYEAVDAKTRIDLYLKLCDRIGLSPIKRGSVKIEHGIVTAEILSEIKTEATDIAYEEVEEGVETADA